MIDKDDVEAAGTATTAVGELIRAAGDTPEAKQAGQNVGRAAVTLTAALNNCLLPIAAVNFAFDKAKQYFGGLFQKDIAEATAEIPIEALVEPKPSLAGPALQALSFSHDEPDLKALYIKLLATSMDSRSASQAHPAFVEILRQLTAKEARTLKLVLKAIQIPICNINLKYQSGGRRTLHPNLIDLRNSATNQPLVDADLPAMIDNWVRLGLVNVDFDRWIQDEEKYSWIKSRPEFVISQAENKELNTEVEPQKGVMSRTAFGTLFAAATGILTK